MDDPIAVGRECSRSIAETISLTASVRHLALSPDPKLPRFSSAPIAGRLSSRGDTPPSRSSSHARHLVCPWRDLPTFVVQVRLAASRMTLWHREKQGFSRRGCSARMSDPQVPCRSCECSMSDQIPGAPPRNAFPQDRQSRDWYGGPGFPDPRRRRLLYQRSRRVLIVEKATQLSDGSAHRPCSGAS